VVTTARTLPENIPIQADLILRGGVSPPTLWPGTRISLAICPPHRCLFHHSPAYVLARCVCLCRIPLLQHPPGAPLAKAGSISFSSQTQMVPAALSPPHPSPSCPEHLPAGEGKGNQQAMRQLTGKLGRDGDIAPSLW
jgi:hypothetical protein